MRSQLFGPLHIIEAVSGNAGLHDLLAARPEESNNCFTSGTESGAKKCRRGCNLSDALRTAQFDNE
jgi:hypothetical protein